jgi:hypothetical protein
MTTSLPSANADARDRTQKMIDDMFASLDASAPWEVEMMYAKADALLWVRDTAGVSPCPPRVAFRISAAAAEIRRTRPDDPTARLIEAAREALREYKGTGADANAL